MMAEKDCQERQGLELLSGGPKAHFLYFIVLE